MMMCDGLLSNEAGETLVTFQLASICFSSLVRDDWVASMIDAWFFLFYGRFGDSSSLSWSKGRQALIGALWQRVGLAI